MSQEIKSKGKPFILQFAEKQVEIPTLQGFYDEKLEVTVIKDNKKIIPLINFPSARIQTRTKTAVQSEDEDEDPTPEEDDPTPPPDTIIRTFVQNESDD